MTQGRSVDYICRGSLPLSHKSMRAWETWTLLGPHTAACEIHQALNNIIHQKQHNDFALCGDIWCKCFFIYIIQYRDKNLWTSMAAGIRNIYLGKLDRFMTHSASFALSVRKHEFLFYICWFRVFYNPYIVDINQLEWHKLISCIRLFIYDPLSLQWQLFYW